MTELPEMMTSAEVQKWLGISRATLTRRVKDGEIPAIRVGHVLRFERAALLAWLKTKAVAR